MTISKSASPLPGYEQVKAYIKQEISAGHWRPGDPVPSETALQKLFSLSRMTINRAVKELAVEGVVSRVRGSGTVVAQLHQISSTLQVRDIREEVVERGHVPGARVLCMEKVRADKDLGRVFQVRVNTGLFHSVVVHLENGLPIQLEERYVNPVCVPDYLAQDFHELTPTRYLLDHAPMTEASYSIAAASAKKEEAVVLEIGEGDACLLMLRTTSSGKHVASHARLLYPGCRYRFHGMFAL
jgi:GntR family histidine utilization transcriptional repressor